MKRPQLVLGASACLAAALACNPRDADTASPGPQAGAEDVTVAALDPAEAAAKARAEYIAANYRKREVQIPMRDGTKLFTAIYSPKDLGDSDARPIMLKRTPYSVAPYGEELTARMGPSDALLHERYIFVYQDVRGRMMSEGQFVDMRPMVPAAHEDNGGQSIEVDEATDTYDTIAWLVEHVEGNNGRVGMWGVSYPGFYAAAALVDAHPALVAVSPQAPIADWFFDDFHHHGAFFLPHAFNFIASFGQARPEPTTERAERFEHGTPDGYQFFLDLGPLENANERYLHHEIAFWEQLVAHPNYDEYWQAMNLLPHLRDVKPAVMTVGGWYDAEDLYGPLQIYREIEAHNPDAYNTLVMGPWSHGGWARTDGERLGDVYFGGKHSPGYQKDIEHTFFTHYLEGKEGEPELPEAYVFETGRNAWRSFDQWPPETAERSLYLGGSQSLAFDQAPQAPRAFDEYVSDPHHPVPGTEAIDKGMPKHYMTDDQRFASRRPDVLSYQTSPVEAATTLAGPVVADLWVSTSRDDADFIVKLIDVFPPDAEDFPEMRRGQHLGNYQMMVRSEVIRGRFRESYEKPQPFPRGKAVRIELPLQDVLHTFEPGHRIMIQVQSTWFPFVDRNPQKWVDNIFLAHENDFEAATIRVYRDADHPSRLRVGVLH